jgi:enoyl-CoA hydratase
MLGVTDPVSVSTSDDGVLLVTLDDGKVNVVTTALVAGVDAALDRAADDSAVTAVVLAGRPGVFSAGFDLPVMLGDAAPREEMVGAAFELLTRLVTFPKPVVAACTGHAIAAGALLLLATDHRVAAEGQFRIGLNEVSIGLPLPASALELARERLSKRHFLRSTLEAVVHDPQSALDAGFVDEVVPGDDVLGAATAEAKRLAALDPFAYTVTKTAARGEVSERMRALVVEDLELMREMAQP